MKILFCTDGSKISYHAIRNFSRWFKNFTVDILCVIDLSFLPDTISVESSGFNRQCANSADVILDYTERFLKEFDIVIGEKLKMCGSTVDSILETLNTNQYEYVVLGSHGKKGIQKWLGSVSQEVSSVAKISTYISKELNDSKKILFTIDSLDTTPKVVSKCIETMNLSDMDIYLTTVYEVPDYLFLEGNLDSNWIIEVEQKQEKAAMLLLNQFEKIFIESNLNIKDKVILRGTPAQEIIKYASINEIDLIVSGARDKKGLSRIFLGSVSKRILENTNSDSLIIRINK